MGSEIVSLHMQQDVKRQSAKRMHKRLNGLESECSVPATVAISELKTPPKHSPPFLSNILTVVIDCSRSDGGGGGHLPYATRSNIPVNKHEA